MSLNDYSKKDLLGLFPLSLPLIIVTLAIISVTYVIFGQVGFTIDNQRAPAARYHQQIVESQIGMAGYRESTNTQTVLVSLQKSDLKLLKIESNEEKQNASVDDYIKLFEILEKQSPYQVIANWNPVRLPTEQQIIRLNEIFSKTPFKFSVYTNNKHHKNATKNFSKFAKVKISEFCAGDTYSVCAYNKDWTFWSIVDLLHQFSDRDTKEFLSTNLSLSFDAFLLNLDSPANANEYSFSEILENSQSEHLSLMTDKIVFVGNNLIQGIDGLSHPSQIGRINSPHINRDADIRLSGTPTHAFWAQVARMFIDNAFIVVASKNFVNIISLLLGVIALFSSLLLGPFISLVFILLSGAFLYFFNILLISQFNFHIPIFDPLYISGVFYIIGGFLRLTVESIREKYNIQREKNVSENIDLKSNFISLISHNLNTPVAKMISLLELSKGSLSADLQTSHLKPCLKNSSKIQLSVRSVLASNKLEDKRINHEIISSQKLSEEIEYEVIPLLNRIGITLNIEDESDNPNSRFHLDRRLIVPVISSVTYLLMNSTDESSSSFFLTTTHDDSEGTLQLEWNTSNLNPKILKNEITNDFADESCHSLYESFLKNYDLKVNLEKDPDNGGHNLIMNINVENQ
jgi:signal transduction histidine kinase